MKTNQPGREVQTGFPSSGFSLQPTVNQVDPLSSQLWQRERSSECSKTATRHDPSGDVLVPRVVMSVGRNGIETGCLACRSGAGEGEWHAVSVAVRKRAEISRRMGTKLAKPMSNVKCGMRSEQSDESRLPEALERSGVAPKTKRIGCRN